MSQSSAPARAAAIELYALPPSEFVAARNARAKTADKTVAEAIRRLTKAAPSAWLAGRLARQDAESFENAVATGIALRQAQQANDRTRITELDRQRRAQVKALVETARSIATDAGVRASPVVMNEITQTINAALADDDAAEAIRTGLLIRSLQSTGLEPVDLTGALVLDADRDGTRKRRASRQPSRRSKAQLAQIARQKKAEEDKREENDRRARRVLEEQRSEVTDRMEALTVELDSAHRELEDVERRLAAADDEAQINRQKSAS